MDAFSGLTKATVTDLITCLSDWSVQNMRSLNVTNSVSNISF
jgi:hypothetical protein